MTLSGAKVLNMGEGEYRDAGGKAGKNPGAGLRLEISVHRNYVYIHTSIHRHFSAVR